MKKLIALLCALALTLSVSVTFAEAIPGLEDGVLTVAMECAYAPYNWAQPDDSNGAVPIKDKDGLYANGYDVMMAKAICEANGWQLEIVQLDWDSLIPAIISGTVDAVIAGQSMTASRMEVVDFAGPYLWPSPAPPMPKRKASAICRVRPPASPAPSGMIPACPRSKMLPLFPLPNLPPQC